MKKFKSLLVIFLCALLTLAIAGCSAAPEKPIQDETPVSSTVAGGVQTELPNEDDQGEPAETISIPNNDIIAFGDPFSDPFVDGNLYYAVQDSNTYQKLSDADLNQSELLLPHNRYADPDTMGYYLNFSNYFSDSDSITDTHILLVLKLQVNNVDAVGMTKKTEFIMGLNLYGGDPATVYYPAYFSEAGKADSNQPLHYTMEKNQQAEMYVGYLVQKEDMSNLIGVVGDTTFQVVQ